MSFSPRRMATAAAVSASRQGSPLQWRGLTNVASATIGMPWANGKPVATISTRRPSVADIPAMPMSRRKTFSWTRAPASLKTRAHARSRGFARLRILPDLVHEVTWSPSRSSTFLQLFPLHRRGPSGIGQRSRRRRHTCILAGFSVVAALVGHAVDKLPAPSPDCDKSIALRAWLEAGFNTCSKKWRSRIEQAWNCPPFCHSHASASCGCGALAPLTASCHDGASSNPS